MMQNHNEDNNHQNCDSDKLTLEELNHGK